MLFLLIIFEIDYFIRKNEKSLWCKKKVIDLTTLNKTLFRTKTYCFNVLVVCSLECLFLARGKYYFQNYPSCFKNRPNRRVGCQPRSSQADA